MQYQQKGFLEFIKEGLYLFGKEINSNRTLSLKDDGLLPSYRLAIYAALNYNKMIKTATLAGDIIGRYSPHGLDSATGVINNLTRLGVFDRQGQFGFKTIIGPDQVAAAPRYTECKLSDKWRSIIEPLMPYVPLVDGEIAGYKIPKFIPTPVPMAFMIPRIGLGMGVNCRVPMLNTQSLIEAYFKNDPNLIKAPDGVHIDYANSELSSLWNTGLGAIQFSYDVNVEWVNGNELIVISTKSAEIFKPDMSVFDKYVNAGKMYIVDMTDSNRLAVGIGRNPRVDRHNFDECLKLAKKIATYRKTFRLTITDGEHSFIIPLKNWLDECYKNYVALINRMKSDKISKATFNRQVFEFLPQVGKLIVNNPEISDKEILSQVNGLTESILKAILTKSISQLRKGDTSKEVEKYQKEIDYWTKLDAVEYTKSVMEKL